MRVWKKLLHLSENIDKWRAESVEYKALNIRSKRMVHINKRKSMRILKEKQNQNLKESNKKAILQGGG